LKIEKVSVRNFGIIADIDLDISAKEGSLVFLNGRNGRGKTTFQSALRWCFYGDEPAPAKFLSSWALNNAQIGDTLTTRVEAEIMMDTVGTTAVIERTQLFQKTETTSPKRMGQPQLTVKIRKSAAGSLTDIKADPEMWVQSFFPKRLINFFLFDGEMMKNFFDLKVKGAVENAVREIAGVDRFDNIAQNFAAAETQLNRKIAKLTGAKAEKVNIQLEAQQKLLVEIFLEWKTLSDQLAVNKVRSEEISTILEGLEGQADAAERLKYLDAEEADHKNKLTRAEEEFQSEILTNGTNSLLVGAFPELKNQVARAKKEDWLPPPFEPARIERLIEDGKCICGAHLSPGDDSTKALQTLIEKHRVSSGVGKVLDQMSRQIDLVEIALQQGWRVIQDKNVSIMQISKDIARVQKEKERLLEVMKGSDVTEIRLLVEEKKILDKERERLVTTTAILLGQNESQTFKVETLQKELAQATEGNKEAELLQHEAKWAREISEAAGNIHQSAIKQVRQRLQESFTEKFSVIKKGKFITEISNDFEVKTLNEFGHETELSEGEKMMKAYIFAIALREVINLGFPLVVDTPFGRLDSPNRAELAKMLSKFLEDEVTNSNRQAFFLMQDTEYTPYTRKYFEKLNPIEAYLAKDEEFENIKSDLGYGIDPDWLLYESWKDWADGKIG
jgi:DNA sulfur modification protein DndD